MSSEDAQEQLCTITQGCCEWFFSQLRSRMIMALIAPWVNVRFPRTLFYEISYLNVLSPRKVPYADEMVGLAWSNDPDG